MKSFLSTTKNVLIQLCLRIANKYDEWTACRKLISHFPEATKRERLVKKT